MPDDLKKTIIKVRIGRTGRDLYIMAKLLVCFSLLLGLIAIAQIVHCKAAIPKMTALACIAPEWGK
jgi:hypothetical protein